MNILRANPILSTFTIEAVLRISHSLMLALGLLCMLLAGTGVVVTDANAASLASHADSGHEENSSGLDCPADAADSEHNDAAHCGSGSASFLTSQFVLDKPDGERFSFTHDNFTVPLENGRLKRPPRLA